MATRFVFPEKQKVLVEDFEPLPVQPGTVRVRTLWSLMSTGTENIAFNGEFAADSHWAKYVTYPFFPGYSCVSVVEEVADDVTSVAPNELVFHLSPHASEHVVPASAVFPIGAGVKGEDATWCALAGVAFVSARRAAIEVGDSVLIVGAGPVAQMSVRWARAAGSRRIIVIDPAKDRLELARRGGATHLIALPAAEARDAIVEANAGVLPSIAIEATGRAASLAETLPLVANHGRLVLVGDTGNPTEQHLTPDLLPRGLTLIGAHGSHLPQVLGLSAPRRTPGLPAPDGAQLYAAGCRLHAEIFFDLVRCGIIDLAGLITHRFPAASAHDAFTLVNTRRHETLGIVFDWVEGERA